MRKTPEPQGFYVSRPSDRCGRGRDRETVDEIDQPDNNEEPGQEEVPAAPSGKIAMAGQRHRSWKASNLVATVWRVGETEQISGVYIPPCNRGDAHDLLAMPDRPHGHHRIVEIRFRVKICSPLISSTSRATTLTQWVTRRVLEWR
jgi:hypothetical protein